MTETKIGNRVFKVGDEVKSCLSFESAQYLNGAPSWWTGTINSITIKDRYTVIIINRQNAGRWRINVDEQNKQFLKKLNIEWDDDEN